MTVEAPSTWISLLIVHLSSSTHDLDLAPSFEWKKGKQLFIIWNSSILLSVVPSSLWSANAFQSRVAFTISIGLFIIIRATEVLALLTISKNIRFSYFRELLEQSAAWSCPCGQVLTTHGLTSDNYISMALLKYPALRHVPLDSAVFFLAITCDNLYIGDTTWEDSPINLPFVSIFGLNNARCSENG